MFAHATHVFVRARVCVYVDVCVYVWMCVCVCVRVCVCVCVWGVVVVVGVVVGHLLRSTSVCGPSRPRRRYTCAMHQVATHSACGYVSALLLQQQTRACTDEGNAACRPRQEAGGRRQEAQKAWTGTLGAHSVAGVQWSV